MGGNSITAKDGNDTDEGATGTGMWGQLSGNDGGEDVVEDRDKGAGVCIDEPVDGPGGVQEDGCTKLRRNDVQREGEQRAVAHVPCCRA